MPARFDPKLGQVVYGEDELGNPITEPPSSGSSDDGFKPVSLNPLEREDPMASAYETVSYTHLRAHETV